MGNLIPFPVVDPEAFPPVEREWWERRWRRALAEASQPPIEPFDWRSWRIKRETTIARLRFQREP